MSNFSTDFRISRWVIVIVFFISLFINWLVSIIFAIGVFLGFAMLYAYLYEITGKKLGEIEAEAKAKQESGG